MLRLTQLQQVQLFWDYASLSVSLTWNGSSSETPDLDLVALVFDKFGFVLECCFWNQRSTSSNALVHSGDARPGVPGCPPPPNGRNEETIVIDIARLPPDQYSVAVCVVSSSGQPFAVANGAEVRITAFPASFIRPSSAAAISPAKRRPITPNASQVQPGFAFQGLGFHVLSGINRCNASQGTPTRRDATNGKLVGSFTLTAGERCPAASHDVQNLTHQPSSSQRPPAPPFSHRYSSSDLLRHSQRNRLAARPPECRVV